MIKNIIAFSYLIIPTAIAFAHGGVDDGDGPDVPVVHSGNEKLYVGIAVGVFVLLIVVWWIRSKKQG